MKCLYCDEEHPETARFCPNTGQKINQPRFCSNCAAPLAPNQSICPACGTVVEGSAPPPQAPNLAQPTAMMATLEPLASSAPGEAVEPKPRKPKRGFFRRMFTCGCISIPVVLLLLALIIIIDPFKLHLIGRITGSYDAAAAMMPADTDVYIGINLADLIITGYDKRDMLSSGQVTLPALASTAAHAGLAAPAAQPLGQVSLPGNLIEQIQDATGMRFPDDLIPWVFQYAGVGLTEVETTSTGRFQAGGWYVAIEARSTRQADIFLQDLRRNMKAERDIPFTTETISGLTVTVHDVDDDDQRIAFTRSGRMVLIASNLKGIRAMLNAEKRQSLVQESVYQQLIAMRPIGWSASLYISPEQIEQFQQFDISSWGYTVNVEAFTWLEAWRGCLVTGTLIPTGVRLDVFSPVNLRDLPDGSEELLQAAQVAPALLQLLPEDTFAYYTGPRLDLTYAALMEASLIDDTGRNNLLELMRQYFNFDPADELIDRLDGEWVLFIALDEEGMLPEITGMPLSVNLITQTSDSADLEDALTDISAVIAGSGAGVEEEEHSGGIWHLVADPRAGDTPPGLIYGLDGSNFVFTTDQTMLEAALGDAPRLIDQAGYTELLSALPEGLAPVIYLEMESYLEVVRANLPESRQESFDRAVEPLEILDRMVLALSLVEPEVLQLSVIVGLP